MPTKINYFSLCTVQKIYTSYYNSFFQVFVYSMFVSQMAFHAKISDPVIGGTYMTLLNTVANLGTISNISSFTYWGIILAHKGREMLMSSLVVLRML